MPPILRAVVIVASSTAVFVGGAMALASGRIALASAATMVKLAGAGVLGLASLAMAVQVVRKAF